MSSIPLSFHSITYRRVKWKQRGGRFQKVFDRDSLFRSVYCLNLDAIENRDCPWGQFSRISENEGEKKVEEEEERQKEKFERTSIERSVFDVARE